MDALHRHTAREIARLMKARAWSINYLADFAGVGRGRLSEIVAAKSSPTLRTLGKIAKALDVKPSALLP